MYSVTLKPKLKNANPNPNLLCTVEKRREWEVGLLLWSGAISSGTYGRQCLNLAIWPTLLWPTLLWTALLWRMPCEEVGCKESPPDPNLPP